MSPVHALAADLAARRPSTGPLIVGLTGAVAAGKSTLAGELKTILADQAKVEILIPEPAPMAAPSHGGMPMN